MADCNGFGQPNFVEVGARPEDEGGDRKDGADEGGVQQPAGVEPEQEELRWLNWKLIAGVGVVAIGGVVMAYFLYKQHKQHKKIQHLERSLLETTHTLEAFKQSLLNTTHTVEAFPSVEQGVSRNTKDISTINDKILNTQRFIVDVANRQKWPWPFNNRIKGLEEEFGLPKK